MRYTGVVMMVHWQSLIDSSDQLNENQIAEMGRKAKARVAAEYTWNKICGQYEEVFVK